MKSASQITVLMLVLAAISVAGAIYYYPWPEIAVADEEVGQPLFEEYPVDMVRGIDIVALDAESRTPTRIQLGRRAEKWVIPSRQNFVATNSLLVGSVVNSLNDRTVVDVVSENAQDHIQYGVVDPDEFSASQNLEAVGRKISLTDRNNRKIAELIVGSKLKDDITKHYVRIPGKPRIYQIEFNDEMLKTEFTYWVSPNPLQLKTNEQSPGLSINSLMIRNNRPATDAGQSGVIPVYEAMISAGQQNMEIDFLRIPEPDDGQPWKTIKTTPEQDARLAGSLRGLFPLPTDDVRRKSKAAADALRKPIDDAPDAFEDFPGFGFYEPKLENGRWDFVAESGSVTIAAREGVLITLFLGRTGTQNSMSKTRFNHFMMIHAGVDHSRLKEPSRPEGLADDESEENKKFRRQLEQWNESVKAAQRLADDLNALHADWFYLVSEDIVKRLLPDVSVPDITSTDRSEDPDKSMTADGNDSDGASDASDDDATKSTGVDKN